LLEEIVLGEMGWPERQMNESTVNAIVRAINGYNKSRKDDQVFYMSLVREICFYAANGGNFKKGISRDDLFSIPGEEKAKERLRKERIKELQQAREVMKQWPKPGIA
jgi:hypothetical protein